MKINVLTEIKDYDGSLIPNPTKEDKDAKLTWREVISQALNTPSREEILTGEQKAKMFQISNKIWSSKEPELTTTEVAFVIERVNKIYNNPLICGRVEEFLNKK